MHYLVTGVAGFIGTLVVSTFLNRKFYPTLMAIPGLMAVIAIGLMLTGHHVWTVSLLLGLWGMLATAAPTGWWTWLARTLPDNAEAGGGLMVAIIQLAIAVGSTVGGFVFDNQGWQSGFALSAALLLSAAVMTWFGTSCDSCSNHHRLICVRTAPLSGMGVGSTQS